MEQHIVYCYTSPSGKRYIGITNNEKKRKWEHKYYAKKGIGFSFHQAIRKYGWENFKYEVLCYVSSRETACLMEMALIKEFDTYYNGYNNTFGGEGFFGLCGEENPLATTKEHYLENSVERSNFKNVCYNKQWNVDDFIEIKDFIKSEQYGNRIYYFYIYKHNQDILTTYEELEELISHTELCSDILSLDNSIDICDLVQEIWCICYNIKKYKKISESILYDIWCKLLRHSESQIILECRNIEIENNRKYDQNINKGISSWFFTFNTK